MRGLPEDLTFPWPPTPCKMVVIGQFYPLGFGAFTGLTHYSFVSQHKIVVSHLKEYFIVSKVRLFPVFQFGSFNPVG